MVSSSADFVISGPFSAFSLLLLFSHGQRVLQRQLGRRQDRRQIAHLASCEVASRSSRTTSSNSFPEELQQRRGRDIGLTLEGRQSF